MTDSLLPTAPALDEPLEILEACHGRIEAQLKTLERLLDHLPTHGADKQARQAAQAILRYFDSAGQHHHEDEEQDLFPRLLALAEEAGTLVKELLADHALMSSAWHAVRQQLVPLADGTSATLDASSVQVLASRYRRHIERENREMLPLARRLLTPQDIKALSQAMTARRTQGRDQASGGSA